MSSSVYEIYRCEWEKEILRGRGDKKGVAQLHLLVLEPECHAVEQDQDLGVASCQSLHYGEFHSIETLKNHDEYHLGQFHLLCCDLKACHAHDRCSCLDYDKDPEGPDITD